MNTISNENEYPTMNTILPICIRSILFTIGWGLLYAYVYFIILSPFYDHQMLQEQHQDQQQEEDVNGHVNGTHNTNNNTTNHKTSSSSSTKKKKKVMIPTERQTLATTIIVCIHSLVAVLGAIIVVIENHSQLSKGQIHVMDRSSSWRLFPIPLYFDMPMNENRAWIMDCSIGYFLYEIIFEYHFNYSLMYFLHHLAYILCSIPCRCYNNAWMFIMYCIIPGEITAPMQMTYTNTFKYTPMKILQAKETTTKEGERKRSSMIRQRQKNIGIQFLCVYGIIRFGFGGFTALDAMFSILCLMDMTPCNMARLFSCFLGMLGILGSIPWFRHQCKIVLSISMPDDEEKEEMNENENDVGVVMEQKKVL